jgi:ABC-type amino acid transport substrate-binding protein
LINLRIMKTKLTISGLALAIIGLLSSAAPLQAATDRSHAVATPAKEAQGIVQAMKRQFDKPQSPLKVAPVVVEGDWALAGWLQDARGGRALLQKRHGHWVIVVCGGDGLRQADALVYTGMTADMATALAKKLNVAENRLPADTLKQFASFEGMLRVDGDAGHGAGHGGQGVQHKH